MVDTKHEATVFLGLEDKDFRKGMAGVSQSMYAAGGAFSRFGTIARGMTSLTTASLSAIALSA